MNCLDKEEFNCIVDALKNHHSIFEKLWEISKPIFSDKISTAAVSFDKEGNTVNFQINPIFWKDLTFTQKLFVISHEMLHVILYHGFRINNLDTSKIRLANLALDIVVNHSLVNKFNFKREEIDPDNKYCWVDTVFPINTPSYNEYYEYYFNLLASQSNDEKSSNLDSLSTLDSHDSLESFNCKEFESLVKETLSNEIDQKESEQISDMVSEETSDIQNKCLNAGCNPGGLFFNANTSKVAPKKKWETIIKNWSRKFNKEIEVEQWTKTNRRMTFLSQDFLIPSDNEIECFNKEKINVFFFLDTSGSCQGYANRFFTAAKTLPQDKFNVKLFCFDTEVYETSLESGKLYGFGGTSFFCIERYIQIYIKKHNINYPDACFIISDGYGDNVYPLKPEKWHWFLTVNYTHFIPNKSKIYMLKDFE